VKDGELLIVNGQLLMVNGWWLVVEMVEWEAQSAGAWGWGDLYNGVRWRLKPASQDAKPAEAG
jgi:hypothetical protein